MANAAPFNLVPGFDFLQNLVKGAGSALPSIGQWVAPTLNPEELEKRIEELRTVQFWLEQNARMIGATIQALEVQRMTLSTLKTMNVQMSDLRDAMKIKLPEMPVRARVPEPEPEAEEEPEEAEPEDAAPEAEAPAPAAAAAPGVVDPMQWWGALTKQFTQLAAATLKESTAAAAAHHQAGAAPETGPDTGSAAAAPAPKAAAKKASRPPAKKAAAARKRAAG
jgi:hypothetical protein